MNNKLLTKFDARKIRRRHFLKRGVATGGGVALGTFVTGCATSPAISASRVLTTTQSREIDLEIGNTTCVPNAQRGGEKGTRWTINGDVWNHP